jgi:hypothetical protein
MATKKKTANRNSRFGWHFLPEDLKLDYGDGRKVEVGKKLSIGANISPSACVSGMHASDKISQAASFNKGPVLCRVLVEGDIDTDNNKFCGRSRTVLWMKRITADDYRKFSRETSIDIATRSSLDKTSADDLRLNLSGKCGNFSTSKSLVDNWFEKWARANGWVDTMSVQTYSKPEFTVKVLKTLLLPRVIRSEKEILKDVGSFYDYDDHNNDIFGDEAFYDSDIRVVENYFRDGSHGYCLADKKKRKR